MKQKEISKVQSDFRENPSPQRRQRVVVYPYFAGFASVSIEETEQNPEENSSLDASQSLCTPSCQLF